MWLQFFMCQLQEIYMDIIVMFSQLSNFNFQQIMQFFMLKDFQYHNFKLINIKIYHKIKYRFEFFY